MYSFRFDEAEVLLKQGADPLKDQPDEDGMGDIDNCVTRIYGEIEFIYSDFTSTVLGTEGLRDFERDLSYLFGLAAHEKMDYLLDLYHSNHIE